MAHDAKTIAGCMLVGEYVEEGQNAAQIGAQQVAAQRSEVVRTQIVGEFVDVAGSTEGIKDFTVLLKDGRVLVVFGHCLRHTPHAVAGQDIYSILLRSRGEEEIVALFKSADVAGIFHGEMPSQRSA